MSQFNGQPMQQWGQQPPQQQQAPPQQFQGPPGNFAPNQFQQPQGGGFVPQQSFQQQPQGPQLQKVQLGQGYAQGQFPYCNDFHGIGQIFPNQWLPSGFEFKAGDKGGTLNINVKIREAWGDQPNQVKIQFIRVVVFGQAAQHLMNQIRAGMIVEFNGNFRPNRYKSTKTQKINTVNQVVLNTRNNVLPFKVLGELPMYEEVNPNDRNNGNGWGNQQPQNGWNQQQQPQQQPQQQWGQPQQQPMQQAPQQQAPAQQQNWGAQPAQQQSQQPMQQQAPQPQQWGQPMQAPTGMQPMQQAAPPGGMPQQPAPGQMQGSFAPPQQMQPMQPMQQQQAPQQQQVGAAPQTGFTQPPGGPPPF